MEVVMEKMWRDNHYLWQDLRDFMDMVTWCLFVEIWRWSRRDSRLAVTELQLAISGQVLCRPEQILGFRMMEKHPTESLLGQYDPGLEKQVALWWGHVAIKRPETIKIFSWSAPWLRLLAAIALECLSAKLFQTQLFWPGVFRESFGEMTDVMVRARSLASLLSRQCFDYLQYAHKGLPVFESQCHTGLDFKKQTVMFSCTITIWNGGVELNC